MFLAVALEHFPTKARKIAAFVRNHKRAAGFLLALLFALGVFLLDAPADVRLSVLLFEVGINLMFAASQLFWFRRVGELGGRLVAGRSGRIGLAAAGLIVYAFLLFFNLHNWEEASKGSVLTVRAALLEAPFRLWLFGSLLGFLIVILLWIPDRMARGISWVFRRLITPHTPEPTSRSRRRFLEQTAYAFSAAPFVAGAYGLFYGRLNLETTHMRIRLPRLPRAFDGFRIAQLSDLHISAFMSAEEIRRYVAIVSQLRPDLVALTGDFVTWDAGAQGAVVEALAGLKAPFGIFGCLGNHEWLTGTEDSITRLLAAQGTHILRDERTTVNSGDSRLNLLGVDYQSLVGRTEAPGHPVKQYLPDVERLLLPDTVNILLSHNPNTFDRAAELGIDLSLSGHTHGGQLALELPHTCLAPARLITPYVRGWFQKRDAQLYVNRGIGTIAFPIRVGARPEITVLELVRGPAATIQSLP